MTIFVLSVPPSVNACYRNGRRGRFKTRKYREWIAGELKTLLAQKAKRVDGPARVSITLPESTRGDCDNRIKPTLDLLVRAGVLADDRSDYVRHVEAGFGKVDFMHVEVRAA